MEEELKTAKEYLNIYGKMQRVLLVYFPAEDWVAGRTAALPTVMGCKTGADAAPLRWIESNWFKWADELDQLHWIEAKAWKREIREKQLC